MTSTETLTDIIKEQVDTTMQDIPPEFYLNSIGMSTKSTKQTMKEGTINKNNNLKYAISALASMSMVTIMDLNILMLISAFSVIYASRKSALLIATSLFVCLLYVILSNFNQILASTLALTYSIFICFVDLIPGIISLSLPVSSYMIMYKNNKMKTKSGKVKSNIKLLKWNF